jgi:hypothetical protein
MAGCVPKLLGGGYASRAYLNEQFAIARLGYPACGQAQMQVFRRPCKLHRSHLCHHFLHNRRRWLKSVVYGRGIDSSSSISRHESRSAAADAVQTEYVNAGSAPRARVILAANVHSNNKLVRANQRRRKPISRPTPRENSDMITAIPWA